MIESIDIYIAMKYMQKTNDWAYYNKLYMRGVYILVPISIY